MANQTLKTGFVLVRAYKGKKHRVTVTDDGFRYGRKTYRSLTAVAKHLTSAKTINGPRWFDNAEIVKSKGGKR